MTLTVNGEKREIEANASIRDLLHELGLEQRRVAVMVNGEIVHRGDHAAHRLAEHDSIDIIHMVGGG